MNHSRAPWIEYNQEEEGCAITKQTTYIPSRDWPSKLLVNSLNDGQNYSKALPTYKENSGTPGMGNWEEKVWTSSPSCITFKFSLAAATNISNDDPVSA